MFLLDTNVVSELRRPERADPSVVRWSRQYEDSAFFLSVFTVHELEYGTLVLERRDPVQGQRQRPLRQLRELERFSAGLPRQADDVSIADDTFLTLSVKAHEASPSLGDITLSQLAKPTRC